MMAMTEQEWLECTDPHKMLEFLWERANDRKLRLFACGSCRLVWQLFIDERSIRAVEAAERYADGTISDSELDVAAVAAYDAYREGKVADGYDPESDIHPEYAGHIPFVAHSTTQAADLASEWALSLWLTWDDQRAFCEAHCDLLRCIFGNPFSSLRLDPSWLAWNDGRVVKLAQAIYDERAFDRMPILADALEEAGCTNADILNHCRSEGEHVRGCWVVDILLRKE
jgi:hypothetical protein